MLCCLLGNHAFRKPITIVVSFEEPINELGQILSQFDDMETNFSAFATRGPSHAFYFGFQKYYFFNGLLDPGYRFLNSLNNYINKLSLLPSQLAVPVGYATPGAPVIPAIPPPPKKKRKMPIDAMTQLRSDVIKRNVDSGGRETLCERVSSRRQTVVRGE